MSFITSAIWGVNATPKAKKKDKRVTEIVTQLEKFGHPLELLDPIAIARGIQKTESSLLAATDPRTSGEAVAWN